MELYALICLEYDSCGFKTWFLGFTYALGTSFSPLDQPWDAIVYLCLSLKMEKGGKKGGGLGCDLLALVDGFTPVEDNIGLLETRFDEEAVFMFVVPEDVTSSMNLTLLSLFFGVTATNLSLKFLMLGQLSIVETDKVNHTMETNIVELVVEIKSFGMSSDDFNKETVSFDELQLKQADLSCAHALIELHLHEIRVVPSMHEADQY
nr:hypothetical protein [Tanacetum cinerariifolium]